MKQVNRRGAGMTARKIVAELKAQANPANVAGMARYGIRVENALGLSAPLLRGMAKRIGRDHSLARDLWATGIHEARILAALVDDPALVTAVQLERWAKDFDSWDVCDAVCGSLFDKTPFAREKAVAWSARPEEFVKRAGFVLMASLAVHDKKAPGKLFKTFLPLIEREAADERNFVKKAVNWALRQIGKRDRALNRDAIAAAKRIRKIDSRSARWIAADALRELESDAVRERLSGR